MPLATLAPAMAGTIRQDYEFRKGSLASQTDCQLSGLSGHAHRGQWRNKLVATPMGRCFRSWQGHWRDNSKLKCWCVAPILTQVLT